MALPPKQVIYRELLHCTLPHLRNVSSWRWWMRMCDRSAYYEAELIHNLPVSMYEPDFVEHDVWFLNVQARTYYEECSAHCLTSIHSKLRGYESCSHSCRLTFARSYSGRGHRELWVKKAKVDGREGSVLWRRS
ncbi:hypothetical protein [Brevifollis gellanilyticus]|uniref:Uncharacterized protein n=1 Tax=Brevifollis gellanilyticus TaxID=748831 RepID=A0A512MA25_9BACT|nr:hypothetical protein [Brevifollis gellanilyticus]GEP43587.1 hypothetical protein BGE01nite_28780 [Brevifollis gellanilyticus]